MRTRYLILNILGTLFFLCLTQGKTYAWFHFSDTCENCPVFESPRIAEEVSKTYAFLPNKPDADSEIRLYRTFSKESFPASAGELNIDIPFNEISYICKEDIDSLRSWFSLLSIPFENRMFDRKKDAHLFLEKKKSRRYF